MRFLHLRDFAWENLPVNSNKSPEWPAILAYGTDKKTVQYQDLSLRLALNCF